jgi:hypothetical protein
LLLIARSKSIASDNFAPGGFSAGLLLAILIREC